MERKWLAIAAIGISIALISISWFYFWEEEATLAERAIIRPDDVDTDAWHLWGVYDQLPLHEGADSYCSVEMYTVNISAFIFVYAFDDEEQASAHYQYRLDFFINGMDTQPLAAGDNGTLIREANGNGTCSFFFYEDNLFVWMDLISGLRGEDRVTNTFVLEQAMALSQAQELKFLKVLSQ